jgi:uncharacterized membrane protein HdeD (DUF308 family)
MKAKEIGRFYHSHLVIKKKEVNIMLKQLTGNWWAVGLRGLLAVALGVIAFVWPGITLEALVYVFGAYAIVDGIFAIVTAGTSTSFGGRWGWMLLVGILGIIAGIVTFVWPGITALALLAVIAVYAFATGIFEIAAAFQFSNLMRTGNGWLLGLSGVFSIIFSILLIVWPNSGLLSLVWLVGFYALLYGFTLIGMAYQLYKLHSGTSQVRSSLTA